MSERTHVHRPPSFVSWTQCYLILPWRKSSISLSERALILPPCCPAPPCGPPACPPGLLMAPLKRFNPLFSAAWFCVLEFWHLGPGDHHLLLLSERLKKTIGMSEYQSRCYPPNCPTDAKVEDRKDPLIMNIMWVLCIVESPFGMYLRWNATKRTFTKTKA